MLKYFTLDQSAKKIFYLLNKLTLLTLVIVVCILIVPRAARAAVGDIAVASTKTEASLDLGNAVIQVKCYEGDYTNLGTTNDSGVLSATTPDPASGCDDNEEQMDYKVIKDGYVTLTVTNVAGGWQALSLNTLTITGVKYSNKVSGISSDDGAAWTSGTGVTVKTGNAYGTTCTFYSNSWYCAVPLADTAKVIYVARDGYVTDTTISFTADRTVATEAQQVKAVSYVTYAYMLASIVNEVGTEISMLATAVEIGDETGLTTCVAGAVSDPNAYWSCPVVLANSNGTMVVRVTVNGYVTKNYPLGAGFNRTNPDGTEASVGVTVDPIESALKITVYDGATGTTALTGAKVEAGDNLAVSCNESAGVYYCAIPLANTATYARVVKDGYGTQSPTYTDRTAATDAQGTLTVHMTTTTGSAGNGGSSSGGSGTSTPPPVIPPTTPIPPVTTPEPQPVITMPALDRIQSTIAREQERLQAVDIALRDRLLGRILLQVQDHGEAWYLDPVSQVRYYLADGPTAFQMLRQFGLGITNADLANIPVATDTSNKPLTVAAKNLLDRLKGKILLQVQSHGEAWYINPVDGKRYYLKDGAAAYEIMRSLSLGITDADLAQIGLGR
ncbi:MAG: hypothetical protein V1846_02130 [Candidatus Komeilibacteria bacterium]